MHMEGRLTLLFLELFPCGVVSADKRYRSTVAGSRSHSRRVSSSSLDIDMAAVLANSPVSPAVRMWVVLCIFFDGQQSVLNDQLLWTGTSSRNLGLWTPLGCQSVR